MVVQKRSLLLGWRLEIVDTDLSAASKSSAASDPNAAQAVRRVRAIGHTPMRRRAILIAAGQRDSKWRNSEIGMAAETDSTQSTHLTDSAVGGDLVGTAVAKSWRHTDTEKER